MKKVISILCVFVIAFSFAACTTTVKTEKTVDAVAEALDFGNKQQKLFVLVNADDGAGFDTAGGNHAEIYIYGDSKAEDNTDNWGDDGFVTVNDDVLLYLDGDKSSEENQEIINKFESLKF